MSEQLDNVIVLRDGIPPLESEEFIKWLADWHAVTNELRRYRLTEKGFETLVKYVESLEIETI